MGGLSTKALAGPFDACCLSPWSESPQVGANQSTLVFGSPVASAPHHKSSFRGLSLGLTRGEVEVAIAQLGKPIWTMYRSDRSIGICNGNTSVGTVRFDDNNLVSTLELRSAFFAVQTVVLSEFADEIFKHYNIKFPTGEDDICSQDVACLTGLSDVGERFIVAQIAGDVQTYVSWDHPK